MRVAFKQPFYKSYKKRIEPFPKLDSQFQQRLNLFKQNSKNLLLKDHALKGDKRELRAFSITGDIRAVYYLKNGIAFFVDIGTHNQVY